MRQKRTSVRVRGPGVALRERCRIVQDIKVERDSSWPPVGIAGCSSDKDWSKGQLTLSESHRCTATALRDVAELEAFVVQEASQLSGLSRLELDTGDSW